MLSKIRGIQATHSGAPTQTPEVRVEPRRGSLGSADSMAGLGKLCTLRAQREWLGAVLLK